MPITAERFQRDDLSPADATEVERVAAIARDFVAYLDMHSTSIDEKHVHGAGSKVIQDLAGAWLIAEHGFREEVLDVFDGANRLRPDFYGDLGNGRGVLVEVERGGTVTNNHDLKDLWKCHLCAITQHLFLMVPHSNWSASGKVRERPYKRTRSRIGTFFGEPRAYVDVLSAWVIGYGLEDDQVSPDVAERAALADEMDP